MKSPAFQWYAADYLADERVMLLSLESEAAYVRLLNYCWREGSIPAKPELCVPMCKYADVKVIKPALALFMKSPGQPGRLIHKRLEEERAKQEAFREKQAENGKRGGRPKKPTDNPSETQTKGLGFSGETQTKPKKSSSSSTSSSSTSNDVGASPSELDHPALKSLAPAIHGAVALTDPADEQHWKVGPLTKPAAFRIICDRQGYEGIDYELYRKQALTAAEDGNISRTIAQWNSWIRNYLNNQSKNGPLRKLQAGMPTEPTPQADMARLNAAGGVIAIRGVPTDEVMNRQLVATYKQHYPNATIHAIR